MRETLSRRCTASLQLRSVPNCSSSGRFWFGWYGSNRNLKDRFTCSLPASSFKIEKSKNEKNAMKIGLDLEMEAGFEYSTSKYVFLSIQMGRFFRSKTPVLVWFYLLAGTSDPKVSFKSSKRSQRRPLRSGRSGPNKKYFKIRTNPKYQKMFKQINKSHKIKIAETMPIV